ncbi:MAG: glycosyltransferase [Bacteroidota bacterium]
MSEGKLRVAHVVEATKGGVHTYVENLVQHQRARGFDVHIIACERLSAPALAGCGATIHRYASSRNPARLPGIVRNLRGVLARIQPNIVHAHSTFAGLYVRLAARPAPGTVIVYQPHGWSFAQQLGWGRKTLYRTVERLLARRTDAIVSISFHDLQEGRQGGVAARNTVLIRNAVPPPRPAAQPFAPPRQNRINVGFAGRFDRQKGLDILIDIGRRVKSCHFHVAGDFSISDKTGIDWPDNFTHLGWLGPDQVDGFYAAMDVMIVPSRWEGFGLVVAEAMRNGCPVIVNCAGALPELVIDGYNGHVVDVRDRAGVAALLSGLSRDHLRRMGANARHVFDACLHQDSMFASMDDLYVSLSNASSRSRAVDVPDFGIIAAPTSKSF